MAISFVASTTTKTTNLSGAYTISKPTGIQSGDVMITAVACRTITAQGQETLTPPSGWTLIKTKYQTATFPCQVDILTRTAGSSEPSSWNGSYTDTSNIGFTIVGTMAYRGVSSSVVVDGTSGLGSGTSYSTATVNNPNATNWRVTVGACTASSSSFAIDSNEVTDRVSNFHSDATYGATQLIASDSGGTVATGNTSRTVSRGGTWHASASYIAIIGSSDPGPTGTLDVTLPKPSPSFAGQLGYSGTMAVTIPAVPTMAASGIASPPDGSLDVLVLPVVSVSGIHEASGSMTVLLAPVVEIVGETRRFGIRVVTPEAESRVTRPRLGAAD